jgi:hypothetical protein
MMKISKADQLQHVEGGGQQRPAHAERRAQQHHRGQRGLAADDAGGGEQQVADEGSDDDRGERLAQTEARHQERACDEHQQADAETRPEREVIDEPEEPM